MVQGSELEGTLLINTGDSLSPASFAPLLLKNEYRTIKSTLVESDGFFLFTEIPPGNYSLSFDPEYAAKNDVLPFIRGEVAIPYTSEVIRLDNILLEKEKFEMGYIVNLGSYATSYLAKAHVLILKAVLASSTLSKTLEVINLDRSNRYTISAAVLRNEALAQKACEFMSLKKLSCKVTPYKIK
jgi:hypothetical protein